MGEGYREKINKISRQNLNGEASTFKLKWRTLLDYILKTSRYKTQREESNSCELHGGGYLPQLWWVVGGAAGGGIATNRGWQWRRWDLGFQVSGVGIVGGELHGRRF